MAWMVLTALAVRLIVCGFLYTDQTSPDRDHWTFAYENGRVARSIALGEGISNPLFGQTGPTALVPPVFPLTLAGVFKVFGIYTTASALAILAIDSLLSALTCIPVFLIARRCFEDRTAMWAGWGWAFFPYGIYFSADWVWPTCLITLLLTSLFLFALELPEARGALAWGGFGLGCGVAALTEPSALSVLPFLGLWACWQRQRRRERWVGRAALASLAFLLIAVPWTIRNYETFHRFIPMRSGLGLELYVGNNGYSQHWVNRSLYPAHSDVEMAEFQHVGETAYMQRKFQQASSFIDTHPGFFLWMFVRRGIYLWTGFWSFSREYLREEPLDPANVFVCSTLSIMAIAGLVRAFRQRCVAAAPFLIVLLLFPLIYCVTHPEVYYRRPIDPMFVILAAYAVASWRQARTLKQAAF
jgi:4-amino-4-deoxy-L-arabinose transferase-like glycosyltransferase